MILIPAILSILSGVVATAGAVFWYLAWRDHRRTMRLLRDIGLVIDALESFAPPTHDELYRELSAKLSERWRDVN